jgi:hypothetical protein
MKKVVAFSAAASSFVLISLVVSFLSANLTIPRVHGLVELNACHIWMPRLILLGFRKSCIENRLSFFLAILPKKTIFNSYIYSQLGISNAIAQGNYYYNVLSNNICYHARNKLSNKHTSTYCFAS